MSESQRSRGAATQAIVISLPFAGRWLTQNSPARRVPSHGTDLLGARYAIDFVGVDDGRRTADRIDWRTLLSSEPVERFVAFGRPILAPVDGVVVQVHDGEIDHVARRSQLTLVGYMLGQGARFREGMNAMAGNHVIIQLRDSRLYVALAHLRNGSVRVSVGDEVTTGEPIAECGNSGNSTQPHVHLQIMDSPDPTTAEGIPMVFESFRTWPRGATRSQSMRSGLPAEGSIVEAQDQ